MIRAALQTKILLAILAVVTAFAAFEARVAGKAEARAAALEQERARFWANYDRQQKRQPLSWGHAAESLSGFQLRATPAKKDAK